MYQWKSIGKNSEQYLFSYELENQIYEFFITNFIYLWHSRLSENDFITSLIKSNKLLEMEGKTLLEKAIDILVKEDLQNSAECTIALSTSTESLNVKVKSRYHVTHAMTINFTMSLASSYIFYKRVMAPLVKTVEDLKESEDQLIKIIRKKEKEIAEYKIEGGKLGLTYLKTSVFNIDSHIVKHSTYKNTFGENKNFGAILENNNLSIKDCVKSEPTENGVQSTPATVTNIKREAPDVVVKPVVLNRKNLSKKKRFERL